MKTNKLISKSLIIVFAVWTLNSQAIQDNQIAPPSVQTIDDHGVNITTGQITASVDTVSIGGERGISHSISAFTNNFPMGLDGYTDKFAGNARYIDLFTWQAGGNLLEYEGESYYQFKVMRVFGPTGTADFKIMKSNGEFSNDGTNVGSGYYYEGFDERHTLERQGNGNLIWTMPDGTALHYKSSGSTAATGGVLRKVVYPNGFTLYLGQLSGVTTNTGFQLKYEYDTTNVQGMSAAKHAIRAQYPLTIVPNSGDEVTWAMYNPRYITAINNAYEYCPMNSDRCTNLSQNWPRAEFTWPGGMPAAMYYGDSVFSVKDANGGITQYHFEAQDVCLSESGNYIDVCTYQQGEKWSPRLVGIKTANSATVNFHYEFKNIHEFNHYAYGAFSVSASEAGKVKSANTPAGQEYYQIGTSINGGTDFRNSGGWNDEVQIRGTLPGVLISAKLRNSGVYNFENDFRNFVTSESPWGSASKSYTYGGPRGNLSRISTQGGYITATYPSSCAGIRKHCNSPSSVTDGENNKTEYTYHAQSGQVETITGPAVNGVRPQTRYEYEAKYAPHYQPDANGVFRLESQSDPIYLPVRKAHCRTTNFSGSSCAGGPDDEVVVTYTYEPKNLLLSSETVTALGDSGIESRTTCYQYDIYGNRIGEILPKGSAACP